MSTSTIVAPEAAGSLPDRASYELPHLAEWLRYEGLASLDLARRSGVSMSTIDHVKLRKTRIRGRLVNVIARALCVPAHVLVGYAPSDPRVSEYATRAALSAARRRLEA